MHVGRLLFALYLEHSNTEIDVKLRNPLGKSRSYGVPM